MSKFVKLLGLMALVVALWATAALAQLSTSKIEGTVRDKDTGQPLAGVQVVVEGTRLGNVTNDDGYYFILNVPPGRRGITLTFTGYQKTTISDQLILAGQTATVNATLSSTIVELQGITVAATAEPMVPRDNTVTKARLTTDQMAEIPATRLEDMLTLEAGVQLGGPGAMARGLRIRGGRLGEEAMVVDGVTVRNYSADPFRSGLGWVWEQEEGSLSQDATPLEFSTAGVEEVDIITGGFQAEYGNAQSGIVNVVTKEGSARYEGNVRLISDQLNPRTSDFGYNQLQTSVGGPVPLIKNFYFNVSGELQGEADRTPTHADAGFRGINQTFVDRLNNAVRNDPVFGNQMPAFTLEQFQLGREFYASKTGASAALWQPGNPVRQPDNWADRTITTGKLTYYPFQGLKLLSSINFSRSQNAYPTRSNGDYFWTGQIDESTLPSRDFAEWKGDYIGEDGLWHGYIPQTYGRRVRTSNMLVGADWDFLQSAERSATLQFRFSRMKTQEIGSSSLKDNYVRSDKTLGSWSAHDIPFELDVFPNKDLPLDNTPEAELYFPNGEGPWQRSWDIEYPFKLMRDNDLYWLSYFYTREWQDNYKADVDFQWNRFNRAKTGVQYSDFANNRYELHNMVRRRDLNNEFRYQPTILSGYLQNRTDLGDFVFNYGLRFDRFDPVDNWGLRSGDQWGENFFPTVLNEWSPRFDVGFPVTDKAQMRFSYGVFSQLPSFSFIFDGSNPGGLEYSRTDAFEAGMSYMLSDDMVLDLVTYYRDVDGNVASKEFFRDYQQWHEERRVRDWTTGYSNKDNGNIKGMDLTLRRRFANNFAFSMIYTLQFSRTTGSQYGTTSQWNVFIDPATGETFTPPDELRPIDGDRTHVLSTNLNYIFPADFQAGTMTNTILRNVGVTGVFRLLSGQPAYDRIVNSGSTYHLNAFEDVTYLTRRDGRPIGGVNYFRGRWDYNLDLRLTKRLQVGGTRQVSVFSEIANVFNKKYPTPYPSGYNYEGYFRGPGGGQELVWSDALSPEQKVYFNGDFNQDGRLSLEEQAKVVMAQSMLTGTMDKSQYGIARHVRMGLEFSF